MKSRIGLIIAVPLAMFAMTMPASADFVINDDLIVDGSACIGFDCVNGESFGFDTLRLKENNLRIKFDDTSSSASFPDNDWTIGANDTSNGGLERFFVEDVSGGRIPFTLEAGAPSNSLYVEDSGELGLGTANPVVELHIVDGDTPTVRLEQDGSSGFTPQTWDLAGNETNIFVRDVTNGSRLPFRIRPGAPTSSIDVAATGRIGIGTSSPGALESGTDAAMHILRSDESASLLIEDTSGDGTTTPVMLELRNTGAPQIQWNKTGGTAVRWSALVNGTTNDFAISRVGLSGVQLRIDDQTGDVFIGGATATANLDVSGTLTKAGGAFKIDHPVDPENKYLSHSFVESPDMLNIYNGNVALDENGKARVTMPNWFEALNREFRYQLTAIGAASPDLHVAEEMAGNSFEIAGGQPGSRVSWQVTGVRHDAFAEQNRIQVEEDKPDDERGFYLHPAAHGQPATRGIHWVEDEQPVASAVGSQ